MNLNSKEEVAFLSKYKDLLGTVVFEVPLYSLEEIKTQCEQANLYRISLKACMAVNKKNIEKLASLPKIEELKLKCYQIDKKFLEQIQYVSLSLFTASGDCFSVIDLKNLKIISFDCSSSLLEINAAKETEIQDEGNFKEVHFSNSTDFSLFKAQYNNLSIAELKFRTANPEKPFFSHLNSLRGLTSLTIFRAYKFEDKDLLRFPLTLRKLTLINLNVEDPLENTFNFQELKYLNIECCSFSHLKFLKPSLKTLILSFENISWPILEEALPHLSLKHLTLSNLKMPINFFDKLKSQKKLRTLQLTHSSEINLENLALFIAEIGIRHLSLKRSTYKGSFSDNFKAISLQSLDISDTSIGIKELSLPFLRKLTFHTRYIPEWFPVWDAGTCVSHEENFEHLKTIKGLRVVKQNQTTLRLQNPNI
ncbi:hypothetical protein [Criblamydia sequanensis]|uniref:Leucine-rich repeat-containing protein n=1 Tax=Candidatus Criblamydia sequanensis CRIB-18 TaxID=1437425 RepID=A0A090CYM1_9BACT|nr:hypothetical protein [Criblamydia sequanensis]CDR33712.1 hypothetical protein CSEC_0884 [Criblamydia sequanensis CRIB-18]